MSRAAEASAAVPWPEKREAHAQVLAGCDQFIAHIDAELAAHTDLIREVEEAGWRP